MNEMTEEQLNKYLDPLNMIYYLSSDGPMIKPKRRDKHDCTCSIKLEELGIKLKKPQAEVTIKNLGLFMGRYGKYPKAEFSTGLRQDGMMPSLGLLESITPSHERPFNADSGIRYIHCKITDPRWSELGQE